MSELTRDAPGVETPSGDGRPHRTPDVLERARALRPLIEAHADAAERQGELTDEVVAAITEAQLWGIGTPRVVGGLEVTPVEAIKVIEAVSYADGSTGWVLMASVLATGTGGAYLGDSAVEEIFAGGRVPVIEGQGQPNGKAIVDKGGYVLSGHWSYGSGVKHCEYVHTGAVVYEQNGSPRLRDGGPEVRIFVLPREQVSFEANWDVLGLRATGSIDYSIEPTFVPEDYTHITLTETPRRGGSLYRLGIPGFGAICHSGFALGVGRRVLDELAGLVQAGVARPGQLADSEIFHAEYARAEAQYRAARAFVFEAWHDVQVTLSADEPLTTRQKTLIRLALNHVTTTVADVCRFAYIAGGGLSLRESRIQRLFRDMHSGTQHGSVAVSVLRHCGRELAGVAPGQVWQFRDLAEPA
jgi:alkylation response protein AidB-like acyl-CoA dehydrogenase